MTDNSEIALDFNSYIKKKKKSQNEVDFLKPSAAITYLQKLSEVFCQICDVAKPVSHSGLILEKNTNSVLDLTDFRKKLGPKSLCHITGNSIF